MEGESRVRIEAGLREISLHILDEFRGGNPSSLTQIIATATTRRRRRHLRQRNRIESKSKSPFPIWGFRVFSGKPTEERV